MSAVSRAEGRPVEFGAARAVGAGGRGRGRVVAPDGDGEGDDSRGAAAERHREGATHRAGLGGHGGGPWQQQIWGGLTPSLPM